jgi:hypothetical protein
MGFPIGTAERTLVSIAPDVSFPTVSNYSALLDLSKCNNAWWSTISAASDVVVYDAIADVVRPRHVCAAFNAASKIGWLAVDTPVSPAGRELYLCSVPGSGSVNAAAAHTNSSCYSAYGYDEASGNILDKTGAYNATPSALTYSQTGAVCKSILFNAANSHVNMGVVTQVSGATKHTFQFLMSKNVIGTGSFILRLGTSGTDYATLINSGTQLNFQINVASVSSQARVSNYGSYMSNDTLALVTVVFNGEGIGNLERAKIYINTANATDAYISTIPAALPIVSTATRIGYDSSSFLGKMDESRFYSRDLSAAEVYLFHKNVLNHNNFASYSYVSSGTTGTQLWRNFKPRFRLGV